MILNVIYDKSTGEIQVSSDINSIEVELNSNSINDGSDQLSFEVAVSTEQYEELNKLPEEDIITEE